MSTISVAYLHCRPDGTPFYVGKGTHKRMRSLETRNPYHGNIVKKHGKDNILVGGLECSSEETALELEKGLIKCLKRMGIQLANMTDGGEGTSGYIHTDTAKTKMSKSRLGKTYEDLHGDNAAVVKRKQSLAHKGSNNYNYGKPMSDEVKAKVSTSKKGKVWYNNGETAKMFIKGTEPEGFIKGRGRVVWQR